MPTGKYKRIRTTKQCCLCGRPNQTKNVCKYCSGEQRQKCISFKGGKCSKCGYIGNALQFHHSEGYHRPWEELLMELYKCILICANCHWEIHYGYNINKNTP